MCISKKYEKTVCISKVVSSSYFYIANLRLRDYSWIKFFKLLPELYN